MADLDNHAPPDDIVAKSGPFAGMNATMGIASMVMILAFVIFTIWDVEYSAAVFSKGKDFIIGTMDWFYVVVVNAALFFVFWLLVSRYGDVKLGKDDDEPDFSTFSWICMLFSAGLGSGLIYWGVAEPMYHIQDNPFMTRAGTEAGGLDAAASAILVTNFHWGLHGWALYVLVGLNLAYFAYRKGLPLTLRSVLYPVLKEKIYGPWGIWSTWSAFSERFSVSPPRSAWVWRRSPPAWKSSAGWRIRSPISSSWSPSSRSWGRHPRYPVSARGCES